VEVNPGNKTLTAVVYTPSLDNLGKGLYFLGLGHNRRNRNTMAKARTDLMQGTLELLILKTLSRNPMHGYGIAQRIHETVDDLLKVEDGSLYPALYRMEERGWIASDWGVSDNNRRAKFYRLTRAGRKRLDGERANWERVSQAIGRILETA
jgi:PadR family transcriptional regulator PadR